MNFLILGGTGYIGSRIVTSLVGRGEHVWCVIRGSSDKSRLLKVIEDVHFVNNDVKEDGSVEQVFKTVVFDWILNIACSYAQGTILYNSVLESNITFPLRILNMAVRYGCRNYLTIGTGLPDDFNMYSFSKKMFSEFGKFYVEKHGINFSSLKLEMFYGPNEPKERFIPACMVKMQRGEPLLLTAGTQRRDIIYVEDVCEAIIFIIDKKPQGYQIIPVGTGEGPTIREVITYMSELLQSESKLIFGAIPMRKGEPDCIADINILKEMGFNIKYPWKAGLLRMIEEEI